MRTFRFTYVFTIVILSLVSCKTTRREEQSETLAWQSEKDKVQASEYFTQALQECVPVVSAAVPKAQKIELKGNPEREAIVQKFVNRMVDSARTRAEKSAEMLKVYYGNQGKKGDICSGEASEYILNEFAVQTNVIELAFGATDSLQLLPE